MYFYSVSNNIIFVFLQISKNSGYLLLQSLYWIVLQLQPRHPSFLNLSILVVLTVCRLTLHNNFIKASQPFFVVFSINSSSSLSNIVTFLVQQISKNSGYLVFQFSNFLLHLQPKWPLLTKLFIQVVVTILLHSKHCKVGKALCPSFLFFQ